MLRNMVPVFGLISAYHRTKVSVQGRPQGTAPALSPFSYWHVSKRLYISTRRGTLFLFLFKTFEETFGDYRYYSYLCKGKPIKVE